MKKNPMEQSQVKAAYPAPALETTEITRLDGYLMTLEKKITELHDRFSALTNKLEPVLVSSCPNSAEEAKNSRTGSCALFHGLDIVLENLAGLSMRIEEVTDRVDL